jgi:hypothetical protein
MPRGRVVKKGLRWTKDKLNDVPDKPGVYHLYFGDKRVYTGKAVDLQRRIKEHTRDPKRWSTFTWEQTTPKYKDELEKKRIKARDLTKKGRNKRIG